MPFCHDRHNQLPIRQRVYHRLRVIRGNALPGQAVGFGCCRDQAVVRAVPFAAVSIRYGPFAEFYLLTALYNASLTIDNYYSARVNYDFHGKG